MCCPLYWPYHMLNLYEKCSRKVWLSETSHLESIFYHIPYDDSPCPWYNRWSGLPHPIIDSNHKMKQACRLVNAPNSMLLPWFQKPFWTYLQKIINPYPETTDHHNRLWTVLNIYFLPIPRFQPSTSVSSLYLSRSLSSTFRNLNSVILVGLILGNSPYYKESKFQMRSNS